MIEIKIEKYDSPIHCIKCGIQTISSASKFIKLDSTLATDSILLHNVSCIDKCECEYGKESHDSHVLKYIKNKEYIVKKLSTENNELYGSVKPTEIAKLILETNKIDIKPSMIQPVQEIKSLGKHKVKISLHSAVDVEIIIDVQSAETIQ